MPKCYKFCEIYQNGHKRTKTSCKIWIKMKENVAWKLTSFVDIVGIIPQELLNHTCYGFSLLPLTSTYSGIIDKINTSRPKKCKDFKN